MKIDAEWMEYDQMTFSEIRVRTRGARGTKAEAHKPGSTVHFGETFFSEVYIPVWRRAVFK